MSSCTQDTFSRNCVTVKRNTFALTITLNTDTLAQVTPRLPQHSHVRNLKVLDHFMPSGNHTPQHTYQFRTTVCNLIHSTLYTRSTISQHRSFLARYYITALLYPLHIQHAHIHSNVFYVQTTCRQIKLNCQKRRQTTKTGYIHTQHKTVQICVDTIVKTKRKTKLSYAFPQHFETYPNH